VAEQQRASAAAASSWKGTKQTKASLSQVFAGMLCFALLLRLPSSRLQQKKKKNPGGGSSSNVNKAKDSGPGQIGAVLFDGTRDTRRHCTGLEIYY
jgi:hypothetical protein